MKKGNNRVFVAMSGGVDSSVAALLLKEQGYNVTGVFIRCFNVDGCQEKEVGDARRVAAYLEIPFYVFDFEKEYKKKVVKYMVEGYRQGITPNPDVMCNKEIKFGLFLKKALVMGADYVATGHYVRLVTSSWGIGLVAAVDINKDQSYFLWTLTQKQLKYCIFPIGDYLKSEVRGLARQAGLFNAAKKDSQGICFLGKVTIADFLKEYIPEKRGEILLTNGQRIGEHDGAYFYTIGQRRLGVALGSEPHYVVEKDVKTNTVVVAEGDKDPALFQKEIGLVDVNFINPRSRILNHYLRIMVRIRYRQPLVSATLYQENKTYRIIFDDSQKFIAPGQSAVFYERRPSTSLGLKMLGGGIIKS